MIPALLAAALVWLPPETYTQWSKVDGLLRSRSELKLTVALTPQMATPLAKAALAPWVAQGRVEIAARVHGDPVLPLVASVPAAPRPDDALERSAEALEAVSKRLGVPVGGFVPGAGAADASLVGPLGASGASWILAGPYDVSADSWAAEGRAVFVPARAWPEAGAPPPGASVVDESTRTESSLVAALGTLSDRPKNGWATVTELVAAAGGGRAAAESVASWPGWDGALAAPPTDPGALAAWDAYVAAAKAVQTYRNSGAADMKVLDGATLQLRRAQAAKFFRPAEPGASALPPELRSALLAVYKRIKAPAPDALYAGAPAGGRSSAGSEETETPTSVHAASGPSWVEFDNPLGTSARAPEGAPNADPWRLRGLRVEWDDDRVLFRLMPGRVEAAPGAARPAYDVYVDLNHLVGAGSIRLLDGRGAFAVAKDAWEFALTVTGSDARLLRAGAGDEPDEVAKLEVENDAEKAEIRVSVPRALLRGNPARWGYVVLALGGEPPRILGLLGSLETQKPVLDKAASPARVPAVRLER
ncbi:MAG TPA: glucodextranase DOMON-like domain-containing protein [Elusimicrobiota bacterium]|nr:glucodextranase DOMON-like domain-containing protein [Elusimicrobiota bacterium]